MNNPQIDSRLALANEIAVQAGRMTLDYFQTNNLQLTRKQDGSPLTIADQQAEKLLRDRIGAQFPNDGIVGEEFGERDGDSGFRWILDPIDGTKSFVCGVPLYGTMVATEYQGQTVIGSVYMPGLDEGVYAARGGGAWWYKGNQTPLRTKVSEKKRLRDSVMVTTDVELFEKHSASLVYSNLVQQVYFARTWGDVYGYLLVATGRAELMLDPIMNIWDAAAIQPILIEAGGMFSDWLGQPRIDSGRGIGTNGHVHKEALEIIDAYHHNPGAAGQLR
jgi:histidinol phosphatase-like enzyme (inositol monophosphatase family)